MVRVEILWKKCRGAFLALLTGWQLRFLEQIFLVHRKMSRGRDLWKNCHAVRVEIWGKNSAGHFGARHGVGIEIF